MSELDDAYTRAYRDEWTAVLAATVRITRDLDLAEDCTQDAFTRAFSSWARDGVPERPGAWLTTVARNRARDVLGRAARFRRTMPQLVIEEAARTSQDPADQIAIGLDDDRLRLIFICCHPALTRASQVALTLRLVGGLSTADVARAFLVREPTMAARITRAKRKIAEAHIPFQVPHEDELPDRIDAVLEVIHLIFTTGHTAPSGETLLREDLIDNSVRLARLVHELLPTDPHVSGLLALLLLTDARRGTRLTPTGALNLLEDQDRAQWDHATIAEGVRLVEHSLKRQPSRYGLQAAIAALHAEAPSWEQTDWAQIVALYDILAAVWPSPVVDLNRAAAIGFLDGPAAGLRALEPLMSSPHLAGYPYLNTVKADLLLRLGRSSEAAAAYREAVVVAENEVERSYLQRRLDEIGD